MIRRRFPQPRYGGRLSRRHIRMQTDTYLSKAGLKRPGLSNHALRHTAATLGYLYTGDLAPCRSCSATPIPA